MELIFWPLEILATVYQCRIVVVVVVVVVVVRGRQQYYISNFYKFLCRQACNFAKTGCHENYHERNTPCSAFDAEEEYF
jgi:ABC-type phosphate transport system auxiliary subunit